MKKKNKLVFSAVWSLFFACQTLTAQYGINQLSPHPSAALDIQSTNQGLLIPRMTAEQRDAISSPAEGLLLYQINNNPGFYWYKSGSWQKFNAATGQIIDSDGDTEISVEKKPDEDKIRFVINGNERYILETFGSADLLRINFNSLLKNIFIGKFAGLSNMTGAHNVIMGDSSFYQGNSSFNIGIGSKSLLSLTTGDRNTAIGYRALSTTSAGNNNTAIGHEALRDIINGGNTAAGLAAMKNMTAGLQNTAVGTLSMENATSGLQNTAVGYKTLQNNTAGVGNTAVGYAALRANTIGDYNTAVGSMSLLENTIGSHNTAYGAQALMSNITGSRNTAYGFNAMRDLVTGSDNTAIGWSALKNQFSGGGNTAVGASAIGQGSGGTFNTAIGTRALQICTGCDNNTAFGYESLKNNNGDRNTAIGYQSLIDNINGNNLTAIGAFTNVLADGFTNSTAIGYRASINANNVLTLGSVEGENSATSSSVLQIGDFDIDDKIINKFNGYPEKGFLVPRMTNAQRNAIINPAEGLFIYSLTDHHFCFYNGQQWESMKDLMGPMNGKNGESFTYSAENKGIYPGYMDRISILNGPYAIILQNLSDASFSISLPDQNFQINRNPSRTKFKFASAFNNIFFGKNSGTYISGHFNICFGSNVLQNAVQSDSVVVVGANVMNTNTYAYASVAAGYNSGNGYSSYEKIALGANSTGQDSFCIGIGREALYSGSLGINCIGLGAYARTSGDNQTAIGARAEVTTIGSNKIVLGAVAGINGATENTSVGIGSTAPDATLHVKASGELLRLEDSISSNSKIRFKNNEFKFWDVKGTMTNLSISTHFKFQYNSNNTTSDILTVDANGFGLLAGTLTQNSDVRLKKDVRPVENCLQKVKKLRGVSYEWKHVEESVEKSIHLGLVAQEVKKVFPELVHDNGRYKSVNYAGLTAILAGAINEMQDTISKREELIQKNQKLTEELEKLISALE